MGQLISILFLCYVTLVLVAAAGVIFCDSIELAHSLDNEQDTLNPYLISMMNTATSIITMGAGNMVPLSVNQFWLNSVMQLGVVECPDSLRHSYTPTSAARNRLL